MNLIDFKQLFTTAVTQTPFPKDSFILTIEGQSVAVPLADLSARELALLKQLQPQPQNRWATFLSQGGQAPTDQAVRLINFVVDFTQAEGDRKAWLDALTSLFPQVLSAYFLDDQHGVIVEPKSPTALSQSDLDGILTTLDADFDTETHLFVGNFWAVNQALPAIYHEERQMARLATSQAVVNLQQLALRFYTTPKRQHSAILNTLKTQIMTDNNDMVPVISALYHHQGNISSAAKALYMHRNTLQYRLDKFQEQTGFSLREMDDLVLCYLLVAN